MLRSVKRNCLANAAWDETTHLKRLLRRPELGLLQGGVDVVIGETQSASYGSVSFVVPGPHSVVISPAALTEMTAAVHLRHGLELAWILGQPAIHRAVGGLIAARTAALFLKLEPPEVRRVAYGNEAVFPLQLLAGSLPKPDDLLYAWRMLAAHQPASKTVLDPFPFEEIANAWSLAGPVEHLLLTGGDSRLDIDPETGRNKYGCLSRPDRSVIELSSCTASSVSEVGYSAAETCRRRVLAKVLSGCVPARQIMRCETELVRAGILAHYGVGDVADAIFAASGTDATLLLTGLLAAETPSRKLRSITFSQSETGTGVPQAATGFHFANRTANGIQVIKNTELTGFLTPISLSAVSQRARNGALRPASLVDADCIKAVHAASSAGRVVLHMIDVSKTGLCSPSLECAADLKRRNATELDIVVDACQARLHPLRLRYYIQQGWPVMITGSKFFTGPPFAGAVLLPSNRLRKMLESNHLPQGLLDYAADEILDPANRGNLGLVLRWMAALAEMKRFSEVPPLYRSTIIDQIGRIVFKALSADRRFRILAAPAKTRQRWESPTIFPFMVRDPSQQDRWLTPNKLREVFHLLNADLTEVLPKFANEKINQLASKRFHIGQPVMTGWHNGSPFGALRLALSARLIYECFGSAWADENVSLAKLSTDIEEAISKTTLIVEHMQHLTEAVGIAQEIAS